MSKILVVAEHADGKLNAGLAKALAAAQKIGGEIDVAVLAADGSAVAAEAAKLDGASPWHEFRWITLPGLRQEIGVCVTVTVIAALASFDIVYIATGGGPGIQTTVPGLEIYRLAFAHRQVGLASALAVVLMVLVILVVLPIQWLTRPPK